MPKTLVSARLSQSSIAKLNWLGSKGHYGTNTSALEIAIDRLYESERDTAMKNLQQILQLPEIKELRNRMMELHETKSREQRVASNNMAFASRKAAANGAYAYEISMSQREQEWADEATKEWHQAEETYYRAINHVCFESGRAPFFTSGDDPIGYE